MARLYKICALSIIVLVIVQESVAFKNKKEFKKIKDLKSKGNSFPEDERVRQTKHYHSQHQLNSQRFERSIRDAKMKDMLEEPTDGKVQYTYSKSKKLLKPQHQIDEIQISKRFESTCGKKQDCGVAEKHKRRVSHLDETSGRGKILNDKKGKVSKTKHLYSSTEGADMEEESAPEDVEYRVCNKRLLKEKKIPAYLVFEDLASVILNDEQEPKHSSKASRHLAPKFIVESDNEIDRERSAANNFIDPVEDPVEESSNSYSGFNDTEEEYEEDFL